jgi:outer membrane lipoprotein SlyB
MADDKTQARQEMADELEGVVAAPGVVASKSQTQGGLGGMLGLGFVGLVVGALLGLLVFGGSGRAVAISAVAFAVAGGTAGMLIGGFTAPRKKLPNAGADK